MTAVSYTHLEENIAVMESKHKALIGKGYVAGQKVILAKPQTFMNLSLSLIHILPAYITDRDGCAPGAYHIHQERFHYFRTGSLCALSLIHI